MALKAGKQPYIRFDRVGPNSFEGVAFVPKVVTFEKVVTASGNFDFFTAPAGLHIRNAFVRVVTALNNTGAVTIGTDGNDDALITTTAFDCSTAGNFASSMGVDASGLYLPAGDVLRMAITGTPTQGKVSGYLEFFELDTMIQTGQKHFQI